MLPVPRSSQAHRLLLGLNSITSCLVSLSLASDTSPSDFYSPPCSTRDISNIPSRDVWSDSAEGASILQCKYSPWKKKYRKRILRVRPINYWQTDFVNTANELQNITGKPIVAKIDGRERSYLQFTQVELKHSDEPPSFANFAQKYRDLFGYNVCLHTRSKNEASSKQGNSYFSMHYLFVCGGDKIRKNEMVNTKSAANIIHAKLDVDFCCGFNALECCYEEIELDSELGWGAVLALCLVFIVVPVVILAIVEYKDYKLLEL